MRVFALGSHGQGSGFGNTSLQSLIRNKATVLHLFYHHDVHYILVSKNDLMLDLVRLEFILVRASKGAFLRQSRGLLLQILVVFPSTYRAKLPDDQVKK